MDKEIQNLEFKSLWKDEYLQWICGYANSLEGGKLYVGVADDGKVIGLEDASVWLEVLPSKIRDALGIVVEVNLLKQNQLEYIEIVVPAYPNAISCKGNSYLRSGTTNQKLTGQQLESFILRKNGVTWEHMPYLGFTIDDLDKDAIENFKHLAIKKQRIEKEALDEDNVELLKKLRLFNHEYLSNAALLLFTKDPALYFTGAFIKVGFFENDADLLYQDEVHGPLLEQVDKTIELILFKYMKAKISYEGIQRVERYFVTKEGLREAILNAIIHKRYESKIPIQISVYKDKIYIANIGELPNNWTSKQLYQKHTSIPYNPDIAHIFYLAGEIESWGRGVEKMCQACEENQLPLPIYHVHQGDIMIQFNAPKDLIVDNFAQQNNNFLETGKEKITEKEQKVIELILEDPGYTLQVLSSKLGLSRKSVSSILKALKEKNIVIRVGSDRKGYWKIVE